ncbi:type II toxin-antitoxin system RelE/ParE family toxin [Caballeronia catudaia]|uniref:type II toxin-antitoxin system RelE/ParE family toxin n=1 Tax=Caballeronia catudaia TaxID=1777136 RepID=UPI0007727579|nr:type II toxin-antitoxin system RelE/ParE family toxin [Caballeronia catudaia]
MRLEWSIFAPEDRDRIFDHIEAESPRAAVMVDDRIRTQVRQLLQFPETGRLGRIDGTREIVISHGNPCHIRQSDLLAEAYLG